MAKQLLILHGYSDGATSFTGLRDYFTRMGAYAPQNVFLLNYASMDDDADFCDFADKLDEDFAKLLQRLGLPPGERFDLACHSTGSLVARAWLRLHYQREREAGVAQPTSPVEHLLLFAPANFGSDLAEMGQSFLGKFRTTFFNTHQVEGNTWETGKRVLQGLEPASPFQWTLSADDLHGDGYFNPELGPDRVCYPFVFAAGTGYGGIEARIIRDRKKPGTDGTVRICGTSLNTRKCVIDFCDPVVKPTWVAERKFDQIPFAIFGQFNHGSLIEGDTAFADAETGPGPWALEALSVTTFKAYADLAAEMAAFTAKHYAKDPFQQFFFRVRDDVGLPVKDYYLDFYVQAENGETDKTLTLEFDKRFESEFYRHSADPSCRALLLNLSELGLFLKKLKQAKARLVFDVVAVSPNREIRYLPGYATLADGKAAGDAPTFLYPNTTTLVEIVMNRVASDKVLHLLDHTLTPVGLPPTATMTSKTGRAEFF